MAYPLILNGDHAEFEREHANTPPHERPDWPLPSFDARDWAAAFCKINPKMPEDIMVTWFANALMRGFDECASRTDRNAIIEECAVAAEAQDRIGREWVADSLWDVVMKRAGANVRALKRDPQ
jgi:hypothetical protein